MSGNVRHVRGLDEYVLEEFVEMVSAAGVAILEERIRVLVRPKPRWMPRRVWCSVVKRLLVIETKRLGSSFVPREEWGSWVVVGEGDAPSFENGWRSYEHNPMRYRVSSLGRTDVQGAAMDGEPGTRVFRLPEECWPDPKDLITSVRRRMPFPDEPQGKPVEEPRVLPDGSVMAPRIL